MRRRSPWARLVALVFVIFMATAPAFAAPRRDDSPVGDIAGAFTRIVRQVIQVLDDFTSNIPK